jgi:ammonia channel protein AmtB
VATLLIALIIRFALGNLRTSVEIETVGLDLAEHGEEGYHG